MQVVTQQAFPQENAVTLENLGMLYQDTGRFNTAYNTYESAIATVELLRGEIISGEETKRKQAEVWNKLYRNMMEVCLQLQEETLALEYIERSKTRNLVELLFNDELYPKGDIPTEVTQQLQQLRNQIAAEKQRLEQAEQNNLDINRSNLRQLHQQREDLISRIIGFKSITAADKLTIKILNQLTDKLKDLPQESLRYTRLLRNIKDYQNTIDINRNNYQEKLRQISAATQDNNLNILQTFYQQDSEIFYKQINADIGYFE